LHARLSTRYRDIREFDCTGSAIRAPGFRLTLNVPRAAPCEATNQSPDFAALAARAA
jgi:hypothetical protein